MRIVVVAAVTLVSLVGTALAGLPAYRNGFCVGVGMGFGNASWEWSDSSSFGTRPDEWAGTLNVQIGGALRDDLVLGAAFQGWAKKWIVASDSGVTLGEATVQMGSLTLAVTWWPKNVGAYVRVGAGVGRAQVKLTNGILTNRPGPDTGPAFLGALGYEWRAAEAFAVGAQIETVYLAIDGDIFGNVTVLDGSIQFSWYW